ncbi:MAG: hypothetical protein ACKOXG_10855 [Arenimonas sp.]
MSIIIKTRLNAGIYKSCGGGETRVHYEWATGPRNLLKAIAKLGEHRKAMRDGYGNIGCGSSWMEIDGVEVDQFDLDEVYRDDAGMWTPAEIRQGYAQITPRTDKAKALIERLAASTN